MFKTCTWVSHISMKNPKDSEAILGTYDIFGQREKGGDWVFYFKSENERFIGG